eukprot:UN02341
MQKVKLLVACFLFGCVYYCEVITISRCNVVGITYGNGKYMDIVEHSENLLVLLLEDDAFVRVRIVMCYFFKKFVILYLIITF